MSTRLTPGCLSARKKFSADARDHVDLLEPRQLHEKLQHPADDHRIRQRENRHRQVRRDEHGRRDERHVQQHRRERGQRKLLVGVEHAGGERRQRDEDDVREHDPRHVHREDIGLSVVPEPGRHREHDPRRARHARQRQHGEAPGENGGHRVDERLGRVVAFRVLELGEDRHEGLRERAFRRQPPQQVRDPEGDVKCVGELAGAEGSGNQRFADQAGHAGQQREAADRQEGAE